MSDLKSIQREITTWSEKAQAAQTQAASMRAKAANYIAGGLADNAKTQTNSALIKDREAMDYTNKVTQLQGEMATLQHEANNLQTQINNLQMRLMTITGESTNGML